MRVSMLAPVEELGVEAPLAELTRLVARLGTECPWTRAQNTTDVVRYTRAELLEVEQAASRSSQLGLAGADEPGDEAGEELADELTNELADELTDELGDVLFNALLLIEVARRERPQLSVDASATAAVRKLRRRAPYLSNPSPNLVLALARSLTLTRTLTTTTTIGERRTSSAARRSPASRRPRQRGRPPRRQSARRWWWRSAQRRWRRRRCPGMGAARRHRRCDCAATAAA